MARNKDAPHGCRIEVLTSAATGTMIEEKAKQMGMSKSQYIVYCVENQPSIPEFIYETDDIVQAVDKLSEISENIRSMTMGITLTDSITDGDMERLENELHELNVLYSDLLTKYQKQRQSVVTNARRLVKKWKMEEKKSSIGKNN